MRHHFARRRSVLLDLGRRRRLQVRDWGPDEAQLHSLESRRGQRRHRATLLNPKQQIRRLLRAKAALKSRGVHEFVVHPCGKLKVGRAVGTASFSVVF